ncbi:glycosyltransferase family 2 protein [Zymobacter palmae]|uniref:glycosyltransferase family 2 protein n=1 Tax=Zymobacter palmae TaxID=33074 RepID=UPI0004853421|nr:glycosyltransferase family 2 protein [Zymobacter palmae]
MIKNVKFSVILPVYNAEDTVLQAVESVLKQTVSSLELIVIDDSSTDNSMHKIIENIKDNRVKILKNTENQGVSYSRNKGIQNSKGEFLAFIDSDDTWSIDKLERQTKILKNFDIVGASYFYVKNKVEKTINMPGNVTSKEFLQKKVRVCFSSVVVRKKQADQTYFENIGHEDFAFIYKVIDATSNKKLGFEKEPLVFHNISNNSLSSSKRKAITWHWNVLRKSFHFSIIRSLYFFTHYVFRAVEFKVRS